MILRKRIISLISALAATIASATYALPEDSQQRMSIDSDTWEFDIPSGTTTFSGKVILQQGSLKIDADKLIIYGKFDNGKPESAQKIVAIGKPAHFQQTPREGDIPVKATANRLEYAVEDESLYLIDDARLDQDGTTLSGHKIEYDVKKALVKAGSKAEAQTKKDKDRVRMVIQPKVLKQNDEDKKNNSSSTETHQE